MSYEADETYDSYVITTPRARKRHTCDACKLWIEPGHMYARVYILHDNIKRTVKRCGACELTHQHLRELCEQRWQMWPDECLSCGLGYESEWDTAPPDEIARLPFLSDDERGRLLEPPT